MMHLNKQDFGQRIANRRKQCRIRQNEFARQLGISNNHISGIENGKENPSFELFVKICIALDVSPDYLLLGNLRTKMVPQNIMDILEMCTEEDIQVIFKLAKHLAAMRREVKKTNGYE